MLAVAAGLDDDFAGFELVRVDESELGAVGFEFLDQGGDVFREAGAAVDGIKVAEAAVKRPDTTVGEVTADGEIESRSGGGGVVIE